MSVYSGDHSVGIFRMVFGYYVCGISTNVLFDHGYFSAIAFQWMAIMSYYYYHIVLFVFYRDDVFNFYKLL